MWRKAESFLPGFAAAVVAYLAADAYVKTPAGQQMIGNVAEGLEAAGSAAADVARNVGEGMVEAMSQTSVHGFAGMDVGLDRRMVSYMSGEKSGDAGTEEETRDLGKPGTLRNPDGSPKTPEQQLRQLEDARKKGRLIETTGKSEQAERNQRRKLLGMSAEEASKEFEDPTP